MSESRDILKEELRDEEYRYAYAEDFLNTFIATQIRVLREQRELTQQEVAELIGTKQAGISRLENVNYSAWKTETLRKLARALGVRLRITFETFGTLLDDGATFSRENLQRPEFADDPDFRVIPSTLAEAGTSHETILVAGNALQSNNVATSTTSHISAPAGGSTSQPACAAGMAPPQNQVTIGAQTHARRAEAA